MSQHTAEHTDQVNHARLTMLGTLVAGIAHELNTPLGAIHSNHDVIERALLKLQDILAWDQPYIFLYVPQRLGAVHNRLAGLDIGSAGPNGIDDGWWIPKANQGFHQRQQ